MQVISVAKSTVNLPFEQPKSVNSERIIQDLMLNTYQNQSEKLFFELAAVHFYNHSTFSAIGPLSLFRSGAL